MPSKLCNMIKISANQPGGTQNAACWLQQVTQAISAKFNFTNQSSTSTLVRNHPRVVENGHAFDTRQH